MLVLTGVAFLIAVVSTPANLVDVEQIDGVADRYAIVAADNGAYQRTNLMVGLGVALAAAAVAAVTRARPDRRPVGVLERTALAVGVVAAAGLLAEALLRATLVVDRAQDLAAGRAPSGTGLTDRLVAGDGVIIALPVLATGALATLALAWHRRNLFGRPTTATLVVGAIAGALLVRADPFANVFVPFFPAVIGFLPAGIVLLVRTTRRPVELGAQVVRSR